MICLNNFYLLLVLYLFLVSVEIVIGKLRFEERVIFFKVSLLVSNELVRKFGNDFLVIFRKFFILL